MKIEIDRKTLAICVLSVSATALFFANFVTPPRAKAEETVRGDQYSAVTGRVAQGGEGLYLTNRDGVMAVFVYDPAKRRIDPRKAASVLDAFNGGPTAPVGRGVH